MAVPPRRLRQLPAALPAKDSDVFPISQMDDNGVATTRAMTRAQNNAEMIAVIKDARQEIVDMANAEHQAINAKIDAPTSWDDIEGKPSDFTPSSHKHVISDVEGLAASLEQASQSPVVPTWSNLAGKPSTFPPSTHTHSIANVTGLQTALDSRLSGAVILGEVDVVDNAVVALSLGVRSKDVTVPASWGLRLTDTLFVTPAVALPVGYAIDNAVPLSTTSIRVYFTAPALALLASNTLKVRVAAIGRTS